VDTVRYFRHVYHGHGDRIFFMIGADAFLDIPMWKEYETLSVSVISSLQSPGDPLRSLRLVIPPDLMARLMPKRNPKRNPSQVVAHLIAHHPSYLLENVSNESPRPTFGAARIEARPFHGLVSARVEEYILKQGL